MSNLDNLKEAERLYMEHVDSEEVPDLEEISEMSGVDIKVLKVAAKKQNWEIKRMRERSRQEVLIAKGKDDALVQVGIDIAKEMGKSVTRDIQFLNDALPQFYSELMIRMKDMDDKNFVAGLKALLDIKKGVVDIAKDVAAQPEAAKGSGVAEGDKMDLGLGADVIDLITKRLENPEAQLTEDELMNKQIGKDEEDEIFGKMNGR